MSYNTWCPKPSSLVGTFLMRSLKIETAAHLLLALVQDGKQGAARRRGARTRTKTENKNSANPTTRRQLICMYV